MNWNYLTKNTGILPFSRLFSGILPFQRGEKAGKETHGEAPEREPAARSQEKIDRGCPEEKEKDQGGDGQNGVTDGRGKAGADGGFQHSASVECADGEQIEHSENEGGTGERGGKGGGSPEGRGERGKKQTGEGPRNAEQEFLAIGKQSAAGNQSGSEQMKAQGAHGNGERPGGNEMPAFMNGSGNERREREMGAVGQKQGDKQNRGGRLNFKPRKPGTVHGYHHLSR